MIPVVEKSTLSTMNLGNNFSVNWTTSTAFAMDIFNNKNKFLET